MSTSAAGTSTPRSRRSFGAKGGRIGGPFERMLGTLRMSDAERLPASWLHPQLELATPSRTERPIELNRTLRGTSPPDAENRAPAPSLCRTADGAA